MKVLGNLSVAKDSNIKYPFGSAIKNETETEQGTPVVREIYNDLLMNAYKILELVGVTPTNTEDNNDTQYQIVEALKKLPNSLNDSEQVLTLTGTVWSIPFDLAYLPNKYFVIARASDNYSNTIVTTFKGTGILELPFTSVGGFSASDEVLVIIDTDGVRAYSLSKLLETPNEIFTSGVPLSFSDLNTLHYKEDGYLITDLPKSTDIQNLIRVFASSGTLLLNDVFVHNNLLVCFCFEPSNNKYYVYDIDINNFSIITFNRVFENGDDLDFNCYAYMDLNGDLYLTNKGNEDIENFDFELVRYVRDINGEFQYANNIDLDGSFEKTTNAIIKSNFLFTLVGGYLNKFSLSTGIKTEVMYLPSANGQIFQLGGNIYFTSGEVAKKWTL